MTTSSWDGKTGTDSPARPEESRPDESQPHPTYVYPTGVSPSGDTPTQPTSDGHWAPAEDSGSTTHDEERSEEPSAQKVADYMRRQLSEHLRNRQHALVHGAAGSRPPVESYRERAVQRPVAVTIYLSDEEDHQDVQQAVSDLLDAFGFELVESLPPIRGSWLRAFIAWTRRAVTSRELASRLQKVERAVELRALGKQQAEIDALQGTTVAQLLASLERTSEALIQIGSVLIIKAGGVPVVRNLTQVELIHLERNPTLLKSPDTILEALEKARDRVIQLPAAALVDQES
jgi:hypothetical protein